MSTRQPTSSTWHTRQTLNEWILIVLLCSFTVHLTTITTWTHLHDSSVTRRDCHANQFSEKVFFRCCESCLDEKDFFWVPVSSIIIVAGNDAKHLTIPAKDSLAIIEKAYTSPDGYRRFRETGPLDSHFIFKSDKLMSGWIMNGQRRELKN